MLPRIYFVYMYTWMLANVGVRYGIINRGAKGTEII
jgi:hypothetical protein